MALTNLIDFIIRAKTTGTKEVQTEVNTMVSSVENGGARVDKILRGQAKLTRRLAAQNKKAFTLAAVGVGPLIRAYANVAASLFALEGVWDAVNIGAKFEQTSNAFRALAKGFGADSKLIIADLKELGGGALTTQNIMEQASLALASGLSTTQLEKLTIVARKAAQAMGRTLPDAFSRLVKGVTKLEPELLDELGITTKLGPALRAYAKSAGIAVQNVSQLEKVQLFTNNATKEGMKKFKNVDVTIKSYSERLQTLKSRLVDYATEISAKAIPNTTILFETIASLSSEIIFLASSFAAYKAITLGQAAATRSLSASTNLAVSLEKQRLANIVSLEESIIALAEAEATELKVQEGLAAGTIALTDSEAILSKTLLEQARIRNLGLLEQKATIAQNIAETSSTSLLATAKRGLTVATGLLSRALGFLTKAFLPAFVVFQVLEATGLLSKAWELLAGKSIPTLQEKLDSLTKSQKSTAIVMQEMGIAAKDSVDGLLAGKNALIDTGEGLQIVSDAAEGSVKFLKEFGTVKLFAEVKNAALASLITKLSNYKAVLVDLIEKQKEAANNKGFLSLFSDKGDANQLSALVIEQQKRIEDLTKLVSDATQAASAKATAKFSFLDKSAAASSVVEEQLAKGGVRKPIAESLNKKDKARAKVDALAAIDVTKSLIIQNNALLEAKNRLHEEEAKGAAANKVNLKGDKENIAIIETRIARLKVVPKLLKDAIAAQSKLNKAAPSSKGLVESEQVSASIKALKAKKSFQTKDTAATSAFFAELGRLEQQAFDLSFERKRVDIANSTKSEEEKDAALLKLINAHFSEKIRLQVEESAILVENQKADLKAIIDNESISFRERATARQAFNELVVSQVAGSEEKIANIKAKNAANEQDALDKDLASKGTFFESIAAQARIAAKDASSSGAIIADSFIKVGKIIQDTLVNKVATSLGLLTDVAKQQFGEQLQAARDSFSAMVQAANEAFGTDVGTGALSADRALQDLQRQRDRKIADLTAKRDSGAIDGAGFKTGLDAINTDFNRGVQDIGTTQDRGKEDAGKKRNKSLLDAQKALNAEMLKANKLFAKENNSIWDSMYADLRGTAVSFLTDLLAAEAKKAALSVLTSSEETIAKLAIAAGEATGVLSITAAEDLSKGTMDLATVIPAIMKEIGLPGLIIGGAIVAGLAAALIGAISSSSKSIKTPTIAKPSFAPKTTFHTGGILKGSGQSESSFVGLAGEGVLNKHAGMKAVGGEAGLNVANATGSLPNQSGQTAVTINILSPDNTVQDSLTIDNFEEFLRNEGSKQMHTVSNDGYIMMDKQSITGLA